VNDGVVDNIRAAGGEVYAVTSEPQRLADDARDDWQLNFEVVGDPHHEIVSTCRDRGWLELIINTRTELFEQQKDSNFSHPKGYFQPGVLALDKSGRVLYRWRGVPTRSNMGGATERPTANHVFGKISAALEAPASAEPADAELDLRPELDSRGIPWPIFISILTANGWFIRPQPFPHLPNGPPLRRRFLRAILRIPVFILAWVVAFSLLPTAWVGAALTAWVIWIIPQIRFINEQFQNVEAP
jgi:peroxiredoxin